MRVLIFGTTGQVGRSLALTAPPEAVVTALGRQQADLTDPDACAAAVTDTAPDVVINAAAYTAVDKAEGEEPLAHRINAEAPAAMARAAAALGIPMLHVSTDYVYDGTGSAPFTPDTPPAPQNAYGRTKLAGDRAVLAASPDHTVLRTSWVFSAHGSNFVKTMLRLGHERTASDPLTTDPLTIVADQIGGPTPAPAIARALWTMAKTLHAGEGGGTKLLQNIHHLSGTPDTSWADFARTIFAEAGLATQVTDIPTADWPTPATRPLNSRLDCSDLTATYSINRPDWRTGLREVLEDLG